MGTSTGAITNTSWHHVAVTKNGGTVNFYIDGAAAGAATGLGNISDTTTALMIGIDKEWVSNTTSYPWKGLLDELAIYPSALSAARIQAHYNTQQLAARTITSYAYDAAGNLASVTDANGKATTYTYDAFNRKASETDPRLKTTTYSYDANGNQVETSSPAANKTTYVYDDDNRKVGEVAPRGNVSGATPAEYTTSYAYDPDGNLVTEADPLGNSTSWTYDRAGRKTTQTDPNSHTTTWAYDAVDRLTSVTDALQKATGYDYDDVGNLTTRTDVKGHVTSYAYDLDKRLTQLTAPGPNTGDTRVWTYTYDAENHRTKKVDANGNATAGDTTDGTTQWIYDQLGRPITTDYSDSTPDITLTYDTWGNRASMLDGQSSNETYSYDALNRPTGVTRGTDSFAYQYDDAGNLTKRTYPDSTVLDYTYDDDSRLATVKVAGNTVSTYAYDADGHQVQNTLASGNGYVETRSYDRAGRLSEVKNAKSGTTLSQFTYTRDPAGNPTRIDKVGSAVETYAYDVDNRITEVCYQATCTSGTDPFIRWTYDDIGNRATEDRPAGTTTYTYNTADELTQRSGLGGTVNYSYDLNGNETAAGSRTYAFNLTDRIKSTAEAGTTITYAYDGDGKRLSQAISGGTTTSYIWDRNASLAQLALERNGTTTLRRYHYGADLISMQTGGSDFYYHYDGIGSVSNLSSATGATQWTYEYEPFGDTRVEMKVDPSAPTNLVRFTGELLDTTTNLYHLRARQYDAETGRFLSTDTATSEVTDPYVSAYIYVDNRPTYSVDPSGLCGWDPREWSDCASKGAQLLYRAGRVTVSRLTRGAQSYIQVQSGYDQFGVFYLAYREARGFYRDYKKQGGGAMGALDAANFRNPAFWFWMHEHGCRSAAAAGKGRQWARECTLAAAELASTAGVGLGATGLAGPAISRAGMAEGEATLGQRVRGVLLDETGQVGGFSIKGRVKAAQLPTSGRIRYVPPPGYKPSTPLPRGTRRGYIDRFDNEWIRGPSRTSGDAFVWDVQLSSRGRAQLGWLSRDGNHVNVSLGGRVTH
jgi:RHS repeat-associated protein